MEIAPTNMSCAFRSSHRCRINYCGDRIHSIRYAAFVSSIVTALFDVPVESNISLTHTTELTAESNSGVSTVVDTVGISVTNVQLNNKQFKGEGEERR